MDYEGIRNHYKTELPKMMAEYKATGRMDFDPYALDFVPDATPIEHQTWVAIRSYALPFYPQIPVLNYFIDFANPFLKIAIECDGKQWHDKEKDAKRDARLQNIGWTVYRIPGHECNRVMAEPWEKFHEMAESGDDVTDEFRYQYSEEWFMNTSDGVVLAIGMEHFRKELSGEWYVDAATRTLEAHRTAEPRHLWKSRKQGA